MNYNIVSDYDWTEMPRGSQMRNNGPSVIVWSYELKSNQIMQAIKGYINLFSGGDGNAFYEKMYKESTEQKDAFIFPYVENSVRSFSNGFADTFQNGVGGSGGIGEELNNAIKEFAGNVAQIGGMIPTKDQMGNVASDVVNAGKSALDGNNSAAINSLTNAANKLGNSGNPGSYVETPQFYQFEKNDGPLSVSFVLYNTINSDWQKNKDLVELLTKINRPIRKSSISVDPPRIYKLRVPGIRFIQWAYCNSFSVELIGNRRKVNGAVVPDAYKITMSFQSLTLEHGGFMDKI